MTILIWRIEQYFKIWENRILGYHGNHVFMQNWRNIAYLTTFQLFSFHNFLQRFSFLCIGIQLYHQAILLPNKKKLSWTAWLLWQQKHSEGEFSWIQCIWLFWAQKLAILFQSLSNLCLMTILIWRIEQYFKNWENRILGYHGNHVFL